MLLKQTGDLNDVKGRNNTVEDQVIPIEEMNDLENGEIQVAPQIIDEGQPLAPWPQRTRKAPRRLSFDIHQADRDWAEVARFCEDIPLI
jgi:hypothetical protein